MSALIGCLITCDGSDCDNTYPMTSFNTDTATELRRQLRHEGWHVGLPGGRDICPDCWNEGWR